MQGQTWGSVNPVNWGQTGSKTGNLGGKAGFLDPLNLTGIDTPDPYQVDMSSAPTMPGFIPNDTRAYENRINSIGLDNSGLEAFKADALRSAGKPSAWAGLANQQQYNQEANAKAQGVQDTASQTAAAQANLAMRGGLNSGAAERIQTQGNKNFLDMGQNVARQGASNRLEIAKNDEQNRIAMEGQLPGMQNAKTQIDLTKANDINANQIHANDLQNQFNMNAYNTQGQIWSGAQNANSTAASAKKGGLSWLCTEAQTSPEDIMLLAKMRRYAFRINPDLVKFYIYECAPLVSQMRSKGADWAENSRFVQRVIDLTKAGDIIKAYEYYRDHTMGLVAKYWPECNHPAYIQALGVK